MFKSSINKLVKVWSLHSSNGGVKELNEKQSLTLTSAYEQCIRSKTCETVEVSLIQGNEFHFHCNADLNYCWVMWVDHGKFTVSEAKFREETITVSNQNVDLSQNIFTMKIGKSIASPFKFQDRLTVLVDGDCVLYEAGGRNFWDPRIIPSIVQHIVYDFQYNVKIIIPSWFRNISASDEGKYIPEGTFRVCESIFTSTLYQFIIFDSNEAREPPNKLNIEGRGDSNVDTTYLRKIFIEFDDPFTVLCSHLKFTEAHPRAIENDKRGPRLFHKPNQLLQEAIVTSMSFYVDYNDKRMPIFKLLKDPYEIWQLRTQLREAIYPETSIFEPPPVPPPIEINIPNSVFKKPLIIPQKLINQQQHLPKVKAIQQKKARNSYLKTSMMELSEK